MTTSDGAANEQEAGELSFADRVIADMRAHGGAVTTGPLAGHPLLILTALGATSGQPRRALLTWSRDGGDYIVAGTDGGAPTDPAWVRNVATHPDVTLEVDDRTLPAIASLVEGPDRERLWRAHVAALPWFAGYPAKAGRDIPVIRLRPVA